MARRHDNLSPNAQNVRCEIPTVSSRAGIELHNILDDILREPDGFNAGCGTRENPRSMGSVDNMFFNAEDSVFLNTAGEPVDFSAGMTEGNTERTKLIHELDALALWGNISHHEDLGSCGDWVHEAPGAEDADCLQDFDECECLFAV